MGAFPIFLSLQDRQGNVRTAGLGPPVQEQREPEDWEKKDARPGSGVDQKTGREASSWRVKRGESIRWWGDTEGGCGWEPGSHVRLGGRAWMSACPGRGMLRQSPGKESQ